MMPLPDILKKHRSLAAAAFVGATLLAGAGCDDTGKDDLPGVSSFDVSVPSNFVRHRSRGGQVTIRTPPAWYETATSGTVELNLHTEQPGSSVNLVVLPATPGETLDKTMVNVPDELRHELADFKQIKSDVIFLKELPAGRLVYEASRGGFHGKLMQIFITKNAKHYILTYTAAPDQFDAEEPAVEQVVASIQVEN